MKNLVVVMVEALKEEEAFSPTTKWNTFKMVINLVAQYGWTLHQKMLKVLFLMVI